MRTPLRGHRLQQLFSAHPSPALHGQAIRPSKPGDIPVCEYVAARTLALPFFTRMTERQIDRVCDVLDTILEKTLTARKGRF